MSREAIAAALARHELSAGERLVAFSLASFADRDGRARPGTPAAAGRAGLKRSWFLEARELLERRGLVVVEQAGTGRGRASTLCLPFAEAGPWWEGEINAELFEAVLGYSRAQGAARLLLAAAAALADEQRVLEGVTTRQLCTAAGLSDTTYRRARTWLLGSGELVLVSGNGGRGKANCWEVADPRARAGEGAPVGRRRVAPPAGQRPLLANVSSAAATAVQECPGADVDEVDSRGEDQLVQAVKGGADRTPSAQNRPVGDGVARRKGRRRTDTFGRKPSGRRRDFGRKGRRWSDTFAAKPRQKPRRKPRHPTRAREGNPRTPKPTPPTPQRGAAPTPSSSRRPTSPSAVAIAVVWSRSTSRRCGPSSGQRGRKIVRPGSRSESSCARRSARARSPYGSTRCSWSRSIRTQRWSSQSRT